MKQPLSINHKIAIGGGDIELYHSVAIDGKVVIEEKKGDSIVGNFLNLLYSFAGGVRTPQIMYGHYDSIANNYYNPNAFGTITNAVSSGANTVITISGGSWTSSDGVQISGLVGDWAACNGFWVPVATASSTVTIAVNSSAFGALDLSNGPWANKKYDQPADNKRSEAITFGYPVVKLGTSNAAVALDDQCLVSECWEGTSVRRFEHTDTTVTPPGSSGTVVEMEFLTSVTNNSGANISVQEAGLYAYSYDEPGVSDNSWVLIARDLFSTIISDGSVAAVTYKLSATKGVEGGITKQFFDILYRHFGITSHTIKDIDNANQSDPYSDGDMFMAGGSGDNIQYPTYSGYTGQWIGVQIGTGNTAMTTDDYALENRIAHGDCTIITVSAGTTGNLIIDIDGVDYAQAFDTSIATTVSNWLSTHTATLAALGTPITAEAGDATNQIKLFRDGAMVLTDDSTGDFAWTSRACVRYYGQLVENWDHNVGTGVASFDVIRVFENVSGTSITVNETALYATRLASSAQEVFCIARHVLTTPVTVAHGEILKVTYTFSVTV